MNEIVLSKRHFEPKPTHLAIHGQPTYDDWEQYGEILRYIEGSVHWWLGDWLNYGEQTYGEIYSQALANTEFSYETLRKDKSIAKAFPVLRRRNNLSFAHHQEAAPLMKAEPAIALALLDTAETEGWTRNELRKAVKAEQREQLAKASEQLPAPDDFRLLCGEMQDEWPKIDTDSIDLILTDPPYGQEYLYLWDELAVASQRLLKPSGWLIIYSGTYHLDYVLTTLSKLLTYYWTICLRHHDATQRIHARNMIGAWKPILIFAKEPVSIQEQTIVDLFDFGGSSIPGETGYRQTGHQHRPNRMAKHLHDWQQGEQAPAFLIEHFSQPGDVVLDPFAGTGTFPLAAYKADRKVIAIDNDALNINLIKGRLHGISNSR